MKRKRNLLTITILLLTAILLSGCSESEPEEIIPTFYNNGVYAPEDKTYSLELPNEKWEISGEENTENISFASNKNKISIVRHKNETEEYQTKEASIPNSQKQLENQLKENNLKEYTIISFRNNIYYDEGNNLRTTRYIYSNDKNGTYELLHFIITDDYIYEIKGSTNSKETVEDIENTLNNFILNIQNEKIKVFKIKNESMSGNTYNSHNNEYTFTLPYKNWNFQVPESFYYSNEDTVISADEIDITIHEQSKNNTSNMIIYEIPTNLEILNKQIEIKNLGNYEVIDFQLEAIGTLPADNEEQEYIEFSYLIKCNNNADFKYYAYLEYRTEDTTYQLTGTLANNNLEAAIELYSILKSFCLTDNF